VSVTGPVTATGTIIACGDIGTVSDGRADLTYLGPSDIHFETCLGGMDGQHPQPVIGGTFTITSPLGALRGNVGGSIEALDASPQGFPFHLLLTISTGTGQLTGASGTLVLDGYFGYGATVATGTITATLVLAPHTPRSKADCKAGGWKTLANDRGQAFPNQGQCVSFVVAHHR